MAVSVRLSPADEALFHRYADMKGITVSALLRESTLRRIEDEYDIDAFNAAMKEMEKNPATYSLDEVEKRLGFE